MDGWVTGLPDVVTTTVSLNVAVISITSPIP